MYDCVYYYDSLILASSHVLYTTSVYIQSSPVGSSHTCPYAVGNIILKSSSAGGLKFSHVVLLAYSVHGGTSRLVQTVPVFALSYACMNDLDRKTDGIYLQLIVNTCIVMQYMLAYIYTWLHTDYKVNFIWTITLFNINFSLTIVGQTLYFNSCKYITSCIRKYYDSHCTK